MIKSFFGNKDNRLILNNYISLFTLQMANYLLPILTLPYLVRVLGAEKYGLVMLAQSMSIFLIVFVDYGFNLSGTREISLARHDKNKLSVIFSAIMLIKVVLIFISLLILIVVVESFNRFRVESYIYYLSYGIVFGQALFPIWFFQGIEKMKFITTINVSAKLLFTILIFVFVKNEDDFIYVPIFNSFGYVLSGIIGIMLCMKYVKLKLPTLKVVKELFIDSTSLFISNFAVSLYTSSNIFILGIYESNVIVGVFSSIEKIIIAIKNIYIPIYQALYPWLAKQNNSLKQKNN